MARIIVDPVTRIEGHLRIEAEVENGKIKSAFSSGTMVRGIEIILKDRDPRDAWAFTQRICNVCTTVHGIASVRAVEDALDIQIPPNANLIRNLMYCAQMLQDHPVHFYHLHALDWVDVVSALKADPKKTSDIATSISSWPKSSPKYFSDVHQKLKTFVESGQLGIFANGYWGHPLYKLPPEVNLLAVAHYLEALDWQKNILKVLTIFGGKSPIPNYVVGGMPCPVSIEDPNAINTASLSHIKSLFDNAQEFIEKVYIPDLVAIGSFYKDWAAIGSGTGNYMAYGDLSPNDIRDTGSFKFPRGIILNRNLNEVHAIDFDQIKEDISHSWYKDSKVERHPFEGETNLNYTGPKPPYEYLNTNTPYSWIKAPRYKGHPMEVGPLARLLVGYASKNKEIQDIVDEYLQKLDAPKSALFSTLGRTLARGLETVLVARWAKEFLAQLISNIKNGDTRTHNADKWKPKSWPKECRGIGLTEAPRGGLAHFIVIKNKKIKNYQCVVPTTWNASPKDEKGAVGPYEAALKDTPIHDPQKPLEILRTIHSFDPCIACAVHLYDENKNKLSQIKVET